MKALLPVLTCPPVPFSAPGNMPPIAVTPAICEALEAGAAVGIGVSGGKDSAAMAYALMAYLDQIGHRGPRLLIHSDLGLIEWRASLPMCEQLARDLGLELVVIHTDMLARWRRRWQANMQRYAALRCVKLVMPWSSAQWRFCTSELKVAPICAELARRFPGHCILSASGIRRDESEQRKHAQVGKAQPKLTKKRLHTYGLDWHPIIDWSLSDVLAYHQAKAIPLHPAYTHCSRVSCAFCVLASRHNLYGATLHEENHEAYRHLVSLEVTSTFSFQSGSWLGEVAPYLLDDPMCAALTGAKQRALQREQAESRLPKHLLYSKGWPTTIPTWQEAQLLSEVRQAVAEAVGMQIGYTTPGEIRDRYAELLAEKAARAV